MYQSLPRGATEIAPRGFFQRSVGGVTPLSGNIPLHHIPQMCIILYTTHLADNSVPLYHIPQTGISLYTAHLADSNVPLYHIPQTGISLYTAHLADNRF